MPISIQSKVGGLEGSINLNGEEKITIDANTTTFKTGIAVSDGSTGFSFPAANTIAFSTAGVERLRITADGDVGIFTNNPQTPLDVIGTIRGVNGYDNGLILQNAVSGSVNRLILGQSTTDGAYIYSDAPGGVASVLPMTFWTGGSERMRIDSSGNVGIGVSNPGSYDQYANALVVKGGTTDSGITIANKSGTQTGFAQINFAYGTSGPAAYQGFLGYDFVGDSFFICADASANAGAGTFLIYGTGKLETKVENGNQTKYPAYMARAWVNFNGTGTVAIRASGNVSSITDNGVGDYTVNFTTAMPDTNYSAVASADWFSYLWGAVGTNFTTSLVRVVVVDNSLNAYDSDLYCVSIFR
jgi:hypothetical protein